MIGNHAEPGNAQAADADFVFPDLLPTDTDSRAELAPADVVVIPAQTDALTNLLVYRIGLAARHGYPDSSP
ncbi:hypothetical protein MJD09_10660 [bacterium]|nr:hypothetical protein [bacterium]